MLDHFSSGGNSTPVEIHTDWQRFQCIASDQISPENQIHTLEDTEKAARNFAAFIASAYKLSTHKITLSELYEELPELDRLLQLKHRLRKLWQETRDPGCKMAVSWVIKIIVGCLVKIPGNDGKQQWVTARLHLKP
jgi:hypothetical protein